MAVELYPHNQATFNRIIELFESSNRVAIVQPTGSGKSFIYLKLIEKFPTDRFVILSPSTEIFTQLKKYGQDSELEITRNVRMITYQALLLMSKQEIEDVQVDNIILDEFHRIGAESWGPATQALLENNPYAKVLGGTATPIRYLDEGKDMAELLFYNNLAQNMSLGEAVRDGILPTPIYVPAWYDSVGKLDEYKQDILRTNNYKKRKELLEELERLRRSLEYSYGASKIFKEHMPDNHGKYIVFCRNTEHLTEMLRVVPAWLEKVNPKVRCYISISAELDRDEQLKAFKVDNGNDAIKLLFTIDRLNEGVHVKGISGVIMLRPTNSPIIYLQQMGRALAAGNGRPLIFDLVNNYQSVVVPLGNGETKNVFVHEFSQGLGADADKRTFQIFGEAMNFVSIFRRLENSLYPSNNEIWMANLGALKSFIAEFGRLPKQKETFNDLLIGTWLFRQKQMYGQGKLSNERIRLLTEVGVDLSLDVVETQWLENFSALKEFIAEFGRLPKYNESFNGLRVGDWLGNQKQKYKQRQLSEERVCLLTEAGIDLSLDIFETQWFRHYGALKRFIAEFSRLPKQRESFDGLRIGPWLARQKHIYKKGKLSEEQVHLLSEIGVPLTLLKQIDMNESARHEKNSALKSFVSEFGRLPKQNESINGLRIGRWLDWQRQLYKQGKLSEDQVQFLAEVGVSLSIDTLESQWSKNYSAMKVFIAEFGRLPKQKETFNGLLIGSWLGNQKQMYRQGKLSDERIRLLTEVGVDLSFDVFKTQRQKHYDGLKDFIAEFGRLPKHNESFNGLRIGAWLNTQKQMYGQGKLSNERIHLLTEAGVDLSVDIYEAQWFKCYGALKEFIAEFDRKPTQRESFNGLRIGAWLNTQKQSYRQGKLSEERERLLTEVGVDLSVDVYEAQWFEYYSALKEFIAEFGHLPKQGESINGLRVGEWLNTQKKSYRQGKLSEERERLLTEAGIDLSLDIFEVQWFEYYGAMKGFVAEFDRTPKYNESFNGLLVGPWLANQKQRHKQGKLSDERIRLLTEAGIDLSLDIFEAQWFEYYGALKGFIAKFGRPPKHSESFNGLRVDAWLFTQKQRHKQGKLSEERARLLTEAGIDLSLDVREAQWFECYGALKEFFAEFGRLPKRIESFKELRIGWWLANQKKMYKQGKLSENRIRLLEEVGVKLKEA